MNENEQMNLISQETNNFNDYQQVMNNKNKKSNPMWIIPVIFLTILILVIALWYMNYTKPEQFYKRLISSGIESLENSKKKEIENTQKNTIKLDIDLETEKEIDENILDLINETTIEVETQIDRAQKQLVVDLKSDYDNDDLIDLKLFANSEDEKAYIYAKDFIDKYLDLELDNEIFSTLNDLYETEELGLAQKINLKKGTNIFKKEFSSIIKEEYCSAEKTTVKVNDKKIKTTKNTIKMSLEQIADGLTTAFDNLKENGDFLNLIEEEHKKDMIEVLEDSKEEIEESINGNEEAVIQLNIYTTGLTQKIVKVEIIAIAEESTATIACTQIDDQNYTFELLADDEKILEGTVNIQSVGNKNAKMKLELKIEEVGQIAFDIEYSQENNISIDKIDEDNISKIDDLTEAEQMELLQNLQKSKLYELIEEFSNLGATNANPIIEDIETNSTTSSLEENQIVTYDATKKITFGIPNGYKTTRIADEYQSLDKGEISLSISSDYSTEEEYYESLMDTKDYMLKQNYYKNVEISNKDYVTIGGRTFYHATIEYESIYGEYSYQMREDYIWTKVSKDNVMDIKIEGYEQMSKEDLQQILTISVSDN